MIKKLLAVFSLLFGFWIGYPTASLLYQTYRKNNLPEQLINPLGRRHQVIGFLPYWLLNAADKDYSKYLTNLTYFGLTIGPDGKIEKLTNPGEEDPGWYALHSGNIDGFLNEAKKNNLQLSLLVFGSDEKTIGQLISNPAVHASNLVDDIVLIMKEYGFTDLNLDIESVLTASPEARVNFTSFVKTVKENMSRQHLATVTIDASPIVLIKPYLINLKDVGKIVDRVVLMTYDFHYQGSQVTGPVAPIGGAGIEAEFDSGTALREALKILPPGKILLGMPLYGYEWETLGKTPRSGVIPQTGLSISNRKVENFLKDCPSCSVQTDKLGQEAYVVYKDQDTETYHQIFYPEIMATGKKIDLANQYKLGGMALWALGYEGNTILNPLENYKKSVQ